MNAPIIQYAATKLDGSVIAELTQTLSNGRYNATNARLRDEMIDCAILTLAGGKDVVAIVFDKRPDLVQKWDDEYPRLVPMLDRLSAHQRRINADKKVPEVPEDREKELDQESALFVAPYRESSVNDPSEDTLRKKLFEAAYYDSNPAQETAAIMAIESPYQRVKAAADTIRAGRRVDMRGLHFLKK